MTKERRQEFKPPEQDLGILAGAMLQVMPGGKGSEESAIVHEGDVRETQEKRRTLKAPRHTYNVSDEAHYRAVSAVDFLSGPPHREQLGKLVERAILAEIKRLEVLHNGGESFPEAKGPLRSGKRPGG